MSTVTAESTVTADDIVPISEDLDSFAATGNAASEDYWLARWRDRSICAESDKPHSSAGDSMKTTITRTEALRGLPPLDKLRRMAASPPPTPNDEGWDDGDELVEDDQ
jgi:hypothetical protein